MAVGNFLILPVERIVKPLVARRSGVQDYQQQKEHEQPGQSKSERRNPEKPKQSSKMICDFLSENRVDCKI